MSVSREQVDRALLELDYWGQVIGDVQAIHAELKPASDHFADIAVALITILQAPVEQRVELSLDAMQACTLGLRGLASIGERVEQLSDLITGRMAAMRAELELPLANYDPDLEGGSDS